MMAEGRLQRTRDNYPEGVPPFRSPTMPPNMSEAAEMLWVVLANVSGGNWDKQTPEWQEYAARWRDYYFAALDGEMHTCPKCRISRLLGSVSQWCSRCVGQALIGRRTLDPTADPISVEPR